MPQYNPFNRKNISKDALRQLRQQMLDCKTLEEANQLLEKFSAENNVAVKQDNVLDTLKNVFLLCAEEEKDRAVTFISYARKILSSNDENINKKEISGVIDELVNNVDKMELSTNVIASINGILDIKHLIDRDHIDYITKPTYLTDEKAVTEAYELYNKHSAWYYEIAKELDEIPYGINFDARDFMPLMHVVMLDNPDCTKEEYQAKCREIKNLLAKGDMEKINKLYDTVYDFRDNFNLKETDFSDKNNCYKLITSLCMSQAYGTMTDRNPDYKNSKYMYSIDGVQKWDKGLEMNEETVGNIADEFLNFGIAINDSNGGSTLPFFHFGGLTVAKEAYGKEAGEAIVDYHIQKYKVMAGEKEAADFNLTEGLLEAANALNVSKPNITMTKNLLEKIEANLFPAATNHEHYSRELGLNYVHDYVFINGKSLNEAYKDYVKEHPEFVEKMEKAEIISTGDKVTFFLLNAMASGQTIDTAQLYYIGDNIDVKMIPLNIVNPKNIRNEVNKNLDYAEVARKNEAGREGRLAREKEGLLNKIKEKKLEWKANKLKKERINQETGIERAKYNDFDDIPFALDNEFKKNLASVDVNSKEFTELVNKGIDKFIDDYKNGAEEREANAKKEGLKAIDELVRGIDKANKWTYSSSNHPEFAAVRDALQEVREAYKAEKPATATYMDISQKDALKAYYKRIETALEKLEIASNVYTESRDIDRKTASTTAIKRYDAVMACRKFAEKNADNRKIRSCINCFDNMLVEQKKLEDPSYKPIFLPKEKEDFYKVLGDSLDSMQGAVTKHDSKAYENVIKAAENASYYYFVLDKVGMVRNTMTIENFRNSLAELMDKSEKYLQHKAESGMKENSYRKVDAVINLYEKTKEMYDALGDKMKTKEEKEAKRAALNKARLNINLNEITLEEKIDKNPAAKRFYYLGKNAPNKKTQEKLYKAGLEVGNSKVKKVKEKVAEKNRERGK